MPRIGYRAWLAPHAPHRRAASRSRTSRTAVAAPSRSPSARRWQGRRERRSRRRPPDRAPRRPAPLGPRQPARQPGPDRPPARRSPLQHRPNHRRLPCHRGLPAPAAAPRPRGRGAWLPCGADSSPCREVSRRRGCSPSPARPMWTANEDVHKSPSCGLRSGRHRSGRPTPPPDRSVDERSPNGGLGDRFPMNRPAQSRERAAAAVPPPGDDLRRDRHGRFLGCASTQIQSDR